MTKKKIGRNRDAEIKKQLRNFAKKEFNEKKPLEIRVLQLKPRVVFKKGSMLPNLMIKNLVGSAYVVYLDYGDQLKFYYFSKDGMSLGGQNFPKTEKILKEMHGKAKTMYKLPKINHEIGLDKENKFLSERLRRLIKRSARKFKIHTKTLPTISIRKNCAINNIRTGIKQNMDFIYFDYAYYNSDLQDTILLREIFPILTKTSRKNETIQIISTMWAITQSNSSAYIKKIAEIKEIDVKRKIDKEAIEWIIKKLVPFLAGNSIRKKDFAEFLIRSLKIIEKSEIFNQKEFIDIFLLWLMEYGIKHYFDCGTERAKYWLYYELLEIYYFNHSLLERNHIKPKIDSSYPVIHLICRYILEKNLTINYQSIDPDYSKLENALRSLNFPDFLDLIHESILTKNKDFLHDALFYLLKSKGIKVECDQEIQIPVNSKKELEIIIKNKTDWCLEDIEFFVEIFPKNRISIKELNHVKFLLLREELSLKIKMKAMDIARKCDLKLNISFKDPMDPKRIEKFTIKTIGVRILKK